MLSRRRKLIKKKSDKASEDVDDITLNAVIESPGEIFLIHCWLSKNNSTRGIENWYFQLVAQATSFQWADYYDDE